MYSPTANNLSKATSYKRHRNFLACTQALLATVVVVVPCWAAQLVEWSVQNPWLRIIRDPSSHTSISAREMMQLCSHDVVLIIDKSRSMAISDCLPNPEETIAPSNRLPDIQIKTRKAVSRWQWCRQQIFHLSRQTQGVLPAGIRVVLFSTKYIVYDNVNADGVETIFSNNQPGGGTDAATVLKTQLDQYFERRSSCGKDAKPLLIAMITDGCVDRPTSVSNAILDATRRMNRANEISLTFLQVGFTQRGAKLLQEVDNLTVNRQAHFDIVHVTPFATLSKIGLSRALVNALTDRQVLDTGKPLSNQF